MKFKNGEEVRVKDLSEFDFNKVLRLNRSTVTARLCKKDNVVVYTEDCSGGGVESLRRV